VYITETITLRATGLHFGSLNSEEVKGHSLHKLAALCPIIFIKYFFFQKMNDFQ